MEYKNQAAEYMRLAIPLMSKHCTGQVLMK